MELWELIARESIRDTIARYNHAGDRGRYDDMVECFAADGVLAIVDGDEHTGRGALRAFFSNVGPARPAVTTMRHYVTNTLIHVESPERATANSYFVVLTDIGVDHWGRYRDDLAPDRESGRWLLQHRSVKTDAYSPTSLFV